MSLLWKQYTNKSSKKHIYLVCQYCILNVYFKASSKTGEFDWDAKQQGVILGSFYYGYILTMLPGGYVAERYSSKLVILFASLGATICTVLSPIVALEGGVGALIGLKIIQGLLQGPIIPAVMALISSWIPQEERSFGTAIIWGGQRLGAVACFALSGFLAEELGWEWDFYFFGILGGIFCILWTIFISSSPISHPSISQEECDYIMNAMQSNKVGRAVPPPPPYKQIAKSIPFWALAVTSICQSWGFYTLQTNVPTYLNNIQHIPLTMNGIVSALPFLLNWLASIPIGLMADWLISSGTLKRGTTRKLMTSIGLGGPALALLCLTFVGCDSELAITILCFALLTLGAALSGYMVNQLELSPNYAGTLKGATSTIANVCGFATPAIVGALTFGEQTLDAWNNVFIVSAALYFIGGLTFVLFGDTSIQSWNTYWVINDSNDETVPLLISQ